MPPSEHQSPQSQTSTEQWQLELFERLVKIESKLDQYNEIRSTAFSAESLSRHNHEDINEVKLVMQSTQHVAGNADACSRNNKDDIAEIKEQLRWRDRTIAVLILGAIVNVVVQLLQ